jgi:hypothetical protein
MRYALLIALAFGWSVSAQEPKLHNGNLNQYIVDWMSYFKEKHNCKEGWLAGRVVQRLGPSTYELDTIDLYYIGWKGTFVVKTLPGHNFEGPRDVSFCVKKKWFTDKVTVKNGFKTEALFLWESAK